ncbi:MAG: alpha/beta hydrolase [bacterium]|nr:alpha/beta hydrolase [bacterium]
MERQQFKRLRIDLDDLEWIYIPDVVYAEYDNCKRHLQMLVPYRYELKEQINYPLILFIPGSAWYKQEVYNAIPSYVKLAERGVVIAVLQYRESTIAHFPAQVEDAKAAIRFLISKSEEFHIDVNNIFIAGNSSGGHIALMTGLTNSNGEFKIRGIIAESTPSDIIKDIEDTMRAGATDGFEPGKDLLGVSKLEDNMELARSACCEKYITRDRKIPPILLFHGTKDGIVSIEQSRNLFSLLKKFDKEVSYYEIVDGSHGGACFWTKEILDIIEKFLIRNAY